MIYSVDLVLPPSTPATALARTEFDIAPGNMSQVFLTFPDGCAGLAYARFIMRETQLYPTNPDSWFHSNNITFAFQTNLDVAGFGEHCRIEGYNLDTINPHTITLVAVVVPQQATTLDLLLALTPSFGTVVPGG
jgi:hypothetical protein